jgi:hypothetical protein
MGMSVPKALEDPRISVSYSAYRQWRKFDPTFRRAMEAIMDARADTVELPSTELSHQQFNERFFKRSYSKFQLMFLEEVDRMPLGNMVMCLWPPDHGKTTTFENYATEKLCLNNQFRMTVASENIRIASKIVGRIRTRLEPNGPFPALVREFGPFKPQVGRGSEATMAQPWTSSVFNVLGKLDYDERDYNMQALGYKSSIVSTRCDHLHIDDLQSLKTLDQSEAMEEWVRQDALSRPGEYGKTSMVGTRVGEDDVYEKLAEDEELVGILKVLRFKAIMTNVETGELEALWPERYNLEQLERQKRKAGQEAWDRNYMQTPNASKKVKTFDDDVIDPCKNPLISLSHRMAGNPIVYVGLDPALGGMNCVLACEVQQNRLVIRQIREASNLTSNEEIMQQLAATVLDMNMSGRVTDVVIESMNFQAGLARDRRLIDMRKHFKFATREHLTGWNKYDENIGIPSMVSSFIAGEIVIPWADDPVTRHEMGELVRQLKAWRPKKRGNKLRQDRVMALWFVWILWQSRWKRQPEEVTETAITRGVPWSGTKTDLIVPIGARP